MDQAIDIRRYFRFLSRYWWLILGCAVLLAGAGAALSLTGSSSYQESILINTDSESAYYLAKSDTVVQEVIDKLGPELPTELRKLLALQGRMKVEQVRRSGATLSGRLYQLTVVDTRSEVTNKIAPVWGDILVRRISEYDQNKLNALKQNLTDKENAAKQKAQTLLDLQRADQTPVLDSQVKAKQNSLQGLVEQADQLTQTKADAEAFKRDLAKAQPNDQLSVAQQLTLISLSQKVFGSVTVSGTTSAASQMIYQVPGTVEQRDTVSRAQGQLDTFSTRLSERVQDMQTRQTQLGSDITTLQNKINEYDSSIAIAKINREQALNDQGAALNELTRAQGLAANNKAQIIDSSETLLAPGWAINIAIGAMAGLLLGLGIALIWNIRRKDPTPVAPPTPEPTPNGKDELTLTSRR